MKKNLNVKLDNKPVVFKQQLKYLGIIIDDKLLFNKHIEHLCKKTLNLLEAIRRLLWLNKTIPYKWKIKIFKSLLVPKIMYASEVWFKIIQSKISYMRKLEQMQRKIIMALTGAFKTTNNIKLLKLLKTNLITEELVIKDKTRDLEKFVKKEVVNEVREMYLEEKDEFGDYEIEEFGSRAVIWCISEHGPFKAYLYKLKLIEDEWCRYCGAYPETAIHLMNECELLNLNQDESNDIEKKAMNLINRLKLDEIYL